MLACWSTRVRQGAISSLTEGGGALGGVGTGIRSESHVSGKSRLQSFGAWRHHSSTLQASFMANSQQTGRQIGKERPPASSLPRLRPLLREAPIVADTPTTLLAINPHPLHATRRSKIQPRYAPSTFTCSRPSSIRAPARAIQQIVFCPDCSITSIFLTLLHQLSLSTLSSS